ncbi:hypothetical protein [Chitinophaga japonensis]|uniref:hypothetical protein n=1 Tax=Chitinophaga japonensis TaxID=104662 RepID=UPI00119EC003|nr:hypothetical protein [Chitinophaga japonensis]
MKKQLFLTACAFALGIMGTWAAKASSKQLVWFVDSVFPGTCDSGATLPGNCASTNTGTICTSGTLTYYQNPGCTAPYYKQS